MRLIDADALQAEYKEYHDGKRLLLIDTAPTIEPEIIRCKDCKHRHIKNMVWICPFGLSGGPDFYCGYGAERRTDA